jgi:hypothetical protein
MPDILITVVSGETTELGLSIPGVQGPVGQGFPSGGTAGQLIVKQSSVDYDSEWTSSVSGLTLQNAIASGLTVQGTVSGGTFSSPSLISPTISGDIAASGGVTVFASGDSAAFFGALPVLCPSGIVIPSGGSTTDEVGAALSGVIVALEALGLVRQ